MRFWAAGGESEKTPIRVKAARFQMAEDGARRGGACPYGCKLVHMGRAGKKNRPWQLVTWITVCYHGKAWKVICVQITKAAMKRYVKHQVHGRQHTED